ncbi:MAG TPA: signal peptidase I, partial [Actinomycetota bacterium]|nr:signal peptidase I [Actinomycetota bacterium]
RGFSRAMLALALLTFTVLGLMLASGLRPLVVRSGSMEPAIGTGDVVFTRMVPPALLKRGEVVTFRDPSRGDDLVTHRVVEVRRAATSFGFVTRGDANTGVERWSVERDGRIGRMALRVPRAGYVLAVFATAPVRAALLAAGFLVLSIVALRRIWAR